MKALETQCDLLKARVESLSQPQHVDQRVRDAEVLLRSYACIHARVSLCESLLPPILLHPQRDG